MERHHNIFGKDENNKDILLICPLHDDCFNCQYIVGEYNYSNWIKSVSHLSHDVTYHTKFEFDLDGIGFGNLMECINETMKYFTSVKSNSNELFINNNPFGFFGYFHPNQFNFLQSSFSFELVSCIPYPNDFLSSVSFLVKNNYYLTMCDFSHYSSEEYSRTNGLKKHKKITERSLSLLKTEKLAPDVENTFHSIISSGMTTLKFQNGEVVNQIIKQEIVVKVD